MYNTFAKLLVQVESSFSDITVQLKRRYDLIPQLVNTIKGSTKFETDTLEKVIQARSMAMAGGSDNPHDMAKNENMITGALKSIFALTESYPDLKSNQNFLALQTELSDTENKIQAARRFYNATVETYMGTIRMFPNNVLAKIFRFADKDFFEDDNEGIQNPVNVDFSK
ncbi:MAG: LemA family protein [Cyanobium sp. MAG06]|nr:LemA family protein [Cyanobium sp. MAG06]